MFAINWGSFMILSNFTLFTSHYKTYLYQFLFSYCEPEIFTSVAITYNKTFQVHVYYISFQYFENLQNIDRIYLVIGFFHISFIT